MYSQHVPASYTITTRAPTDAERERIARLTRPDAGSYGCLLIMFGSLPLAVLLVAIAALTGLVPPPTITVWIILGSGFVLTMWALVYVLIGYRRFESRQREKAARDVRRMQIQEIEVRTQRAAEIVPSDENGPILAIDLSDKALILQGQWLYDNAIYGAPRSRDDHDTFNSLPEPHAFPSTHFTITRLPKSGAVLAISVLGDTITPDTSDAVISQHLDPQESRLLDATFDDLPGALARL